MIAYDCKWINQTSYNIDDVKNAVTLALELLQSRVDDAGGMPTTANLIQKVTIITHDATSKLVARAFKQSQFATAEYKKVRTVKTKAIVGQNLTIALAEPQDAAGSSAEKMLVLATQRATQFFVQEVLKAIIVSHPEYMTFVRGLLYRDFIPAENEEMPEGWRYGCRMNPDALIALTGSIADKFVLEKRAAIRFVYTADFVLPEDVVLWRRR